MSFPDGDGLPAFPGGSKLIAVEPHPDMAGWLGPEGGAFEKFQEGRIGLEELPEHFQKPAFLPHGPDSRSMDSQPKL